LSEKIKEMDELKLKFKQLQQSYNSLHKHALKIESKYNEQKKELEILKKGTFLAEQQLIPPRSPIGQITVIPSNHNDDSYHNSNNNKDTSQYDDSETQNGSILISDTACKHAKQLISLGEDTTTLISIDTDRISGTINSLAFTPRMAKGSNKRKKGIDRKGSRKKKRVSKHSNNSVQRNELKKKILKSDEEDEYSVIEVSDSDDIHNEDRKGVSSRANKNFDWNEIKVKNDHRDLSIFPIRNPLREESGEKEKAEEEVVEKRRKKKTTEFAHVSVVRNKVERSELPGRECEHCKKFYEAVNENGILLAAHECSRHRSAYPRPNTPPHFWDVEFPDTEQQDKDVAPS